MFNEYKLNVCHTEMCNLKKEESNELGGIDVIRLVLLLLLLSRWKKILLAPVWSKLQPHLLVRTNLGG